MGTYTKNLRLYKPSETDYYNVETDQNANFDIIDSKFYELQTSMNGKENSIIKKAGFNLDKSNAIDSTREDVLATSLAVKLAYDRASQGDNSKVSKSGDSMTGDLIMGDGKRFIGAHNYGYMSKDSRGNQKYIMYIDTSNRLHIGHNNEAPIYFDADTLTTRAGNIWHAGNFNPDAKVDKNNQNLDTSSKEVIGAINEVYNREFLPFKKTFRIGGDPNTYYPVLIDTNDSFNNIQKIRIFRAYHWSAPSSWNTTTHRGSLMLDIDIFYHGWGGYLYYAVGYCTQLYSKIISKFGICGPDSSMICIWLRGGGADYQISSTSKNITNSVDIKYSKYVRTIRSGTTDYNGEVSPTTRVEDSKFDSTELNFYGLFLHNLDFRIGNIFSSGNITSNGTITGSKIYNAVWNDYAELFPKQKGYITEAGDIIALKEDCDDEIYEKATEMHQVIVGVHSDQFAQLIGGETPIDNSDLYEFNKDKYIPIGLAGRLKVKCIGIVKKGDKIVPSNIPGVGRIFKKGDTQDKIVGIALENKNTLTLGKVKIKI